MVGTRRSTRDGGGSKSKKEEQRTITDFFSRCTGPSSLSNTPAKPLAASQVSTPVRSTSPPRESSSPPPTARRLNYKLQPVHGARALDSCSLDLTALADCERAKNIAASVDAKRKQILSTDIIDVDALPDPIVDIDTDQATERVHQQFMNLDTSLDGTMGNKSAKSSTKSSKSSKSTRRKSSNKKPRNSKNTIAKTEDEVLIVSTTPSPRRRSPLIAGEPVLFDNAASSSTTTRTKSTRKKRRSKEQQDGDGDIDVVMTDKSKSDQVINLCDSDTPPGDTNHAASSSSQRLPSSRPPNKLSKTEPKEETSSRNNNNIKPSPVPRETFFDAVAEQQTRNVADAVDSDGDNRMEDAAEGDDEHEYEHSEPMEEEKKPAASPPENDVDIDDDDSSDDEELMRQLILDARKSERLKASLARSSGGDTSFDMPSVTVRASTRSVFGTTNYRKEAAQTTRQMAQMLKERNRRDALEEENKELRNEIIAAEKKEMDEPEMFIKTMADAERRNAEERKRLHEKYHAAIALFISKPSFPEITRKGTRRFWNPPHTPGGNKRKHQLHEMLLRAHQNNVCCGRTFLKAVDLCCVSQKLNPPNIIAEILFDRVVFDESFSNQKTKASVYTSREIEYEALILIISYSTKELPLPSMMSVLTTYGAAYNPRRRSVDIMENSDADSFDKKMMGQGNMDDISQRAIRNLTRAFNIWTRQVESEMELAKILGEQQKAKPGLSSTASYCLEMADLCFRILLSPFGSRLAPGLEQLFDAVLDRVEENEWNVFRQQCAADLVDDTRKIGLIADLAIYLMSVRTERSRGLGLDIAYMTLWCWHKGPPAEPTMVPVEEFKWPHDNSDVDMGFSFRFGDIVDIVAGIPELGKEAEVTWALALARVLNHATIHHDVLDSRKKGEYKRLADVVKKIRLWSHRMEYGVAQKKFQFALDSLITATQGFIGNGIAHKELNPGVEEGRKQSTLSFAGMKKK